jgi:hypothetical protein
VDELAPLTRANKADQDRELRLDRAPLDRRMRLDQHEIARLPATGNPETILDRPFEKLTQLTMAKAPAICKACDLAKHTRRKWDNVGDGEVELEVRSTCSAPRCVKDEEKPLRLHSIKSGRNVRIKPDPVTEPAPQPAPRTTYGDW